MERASAQRVEPAVARPRARRRSLCDVRRAAAAPSLPLSPLYPRAAVAQELADDLPPNDYYEYFVPDWKLHLQPNPQMENLNTRAYLEGIKQQALENLRALQGAPSVQMAQMPPAMHSDDERDADEDADARVDNHRHIAEPYENELDQDRP